ncbi:MAG: S41 family peptidase [Sphingomonas sp.]|uniref:S41 family peptidase n=1 Tax=Sphingomonas sp. TaxID=28214 RepID=UPI00184F109F|nr:S41 family peptidase [Sphingomonas sp.]MBA3667278.1 S41 family peptidase [Sphingomonas sp.]
MRIRLPLLPAALILLIGASATAQTQSAPTPAVPPTAPATIPFVKSEAEGVVRDLATKLEDNFVFPDIAKQYAAMLRLNLAAGKYANFADADRFAKAVTADLQAVHKDGHLHLKATRPDEGGKRELRQLPTSSAVVKSGWLADRVAFIEFAGFPGNDATMADLRTFLVAHRGAKTLIIDARHHRGGGLAEMNVLFPQIFPRETVLVDMDTRVAVDKRTGGKTENFMRKVAGPVGVVRREHYVVPAKNQGELGHAKVYLLVSKRTGSAGEHLSLSLKRTHRATLIGESTYGAGHYGGFQPIGSGFVAFIPVGRTFDPDTGEGWEGTGVKPDIEVPADKALDEALRLAGVDKSAEAALTELR